MADALVAEDTLSPKVWPHWTPTHWAIADAPLVNMPSALRNLEIPFEDLIALSEAMVANREKMGPHPGSWTRWVITPQRLAA